MRHGRRAPNGERGSTRSTSVGTARPTRAAGARSPAPNDQYTIELLPATGYEVAGDRPTKQDSVHRLVARARSGSASPGRVGTDANARTRSIIATFRRDSFLNFVYFTDYENRDPRRETDAAKRATQQQQLRRQVPLGSAPARAARRSSSPPATRSTARCTPTTRAC